MGRLTTHVLDTASGKPAAGVRVMLRRDGEAAVVAEGATKTDGRMDKPLLEGAAFKNGRYELTFHVGDYFRKSGSALADPAFLDVIPLRFTIAEDAHYHVPLLVSPYGYSTYRGKLMDVFLGEWLNLMLRWAHMVVGIGWIGTSFYFMALDYTLMKRERMNPGVYGTAWQVHGGGFYHVEKYTVAPPALPDVLHWFKWEAYLTFVTGFGLLIVQYYVHAEAYLIDPAVMPLTQWQAIAISVVSLTAGWFIYDCLCRTKVGEHTVVLALAVFALILLASVLYTRVFSGRGAFIHVGALVGTIMAANVFAIIIPNQKKMIAQMIAGQTPEARFGIIGKQRSIHNNYLTLPVLLMMVSQHYPFLFSHPQSWLVVALILISGGLVRHILNRLDAGDDWDGYGWALPAAALALLAAIYVTAPQARTAAAGAPVTDSQALAITTKHCTSCHAKAPSHPAFREPPKNVSLETVVDMRRWGKLIVAQTVQNRAMPMGNQTGMTDEEREMLGRWVNGAK